MTDHNPYAGLRQAFLTMGAEVIDAPLRGAMIEFGIPGGSVSVVCAADGTTSMYTSAGGGIIGAGEQEPVRRANAAFCAAVRDHLDRLVPVDDVAPPAAGQVNIVAVTADGLRLLQGPESTMADQSSFAWPLFLAGQGVVTQLRLLDERRRTSQAN